MRVCVVLRFFIEFALVARPDTHAFFLFKVVGEENNKDTIFWRRGEAVAGQARPSAPAGAPEGAHRIYQAGSRRGEGSEADPLPSADRREAKGRGIPPSGGRTGAHRESPHTKRAVRRLFTPRRA